MTADEPEMPELARLVRGMYHWINDPQHQQSPCFPTVYDQFAQEFTHAPGSTGSWRPGADWRPAQRAARTFP